MIANALDLVTGVRQGALVERKIEYEFELDFRC